MLLLPLELQEQIILAGRDHRYFLLACALVCRGWVPCSRSLLRLSLKLDVSGSDSAREQLDKMEDVIAKPATTTLGGSVESVFVWMGNYGVLKSDDGTSPDLRDQTIVANVLSKIRSVRHIQLRGGSLSNNHERNITYLLAKAFPNVQHVVLHNWECSDFSRVTHLLSQLTCLSCVEFYSPGFRFSIPPSGVKWDPQPEMEPPPSLRSFIIHDFDVLREHSEPTITGHARLFSWVAKAPFLHQVTLHTVAEFLDGRITPQMIRALEPLDMFLVTVKRFHVFTLEGGFDDIFRLATSFTIHLPNLTDEDGPSLSEVLLVDPQWPRLECLTLTEFAPPIDEMQRTDWNEVCDVLKDAPRMKTLRIPMQSDEFMLESFDKLRDAGIEVCMIVEQDRDL